MSQMMKPGAVLRIHDLIFDFQPSEANEVFDRWFAKAADDPDHGYTAKELAEHIRTEYSTFRWLFEPMLAAAGFEIVTAEFEGRIRHLHVCEALIAPTLAWAGTIRS